MGFWGDFKADYPRTAWAVLSIALLAGLIYVLLPAIDRVIVPRHPTTIEIREPYETTVYRSLSPPDHGVRIIRADGRRETLQSDPLYDHHANSGTHQAEASGWLDRIVSVTITGRKIEVGEALSYDILIALVLSAILAIRILRGVGRRRRT